MLNYLKWELKNYFTSKSRWFIVIGIVYLLMLILPMTSSTGLISGLVALAYMIIMSISFIGAYFAGTRHAVNTFSKKTFLLESMIPVSAKKILLSKYILGIIINFIYIILIALGVMIVLIKGIGIEDTLAAYKFIFENLSFQTVFTLICTSVLFLSVVVLSYVSVKAFNPSGRHEKITGFVVAVIAVYFVNYILIRIIGSTTTNIYIIDMIYLITSAISFFITAYLIENKLEIYN